MFSEINLNNIRIMLKGPRMFLVEIKSTDFKDSRGIEIKGNEITIEEIINFVTSIFVNEVTTFNFPANDIIVRNMTNSEQAKMIETISKIKNNLKNLIMK